MRASNGRSAERHETPATGQDTRCDAARRHPRAVKLSAGVVLVRRRDGQPLYLLLRVYRYWDFPKGEIGRDENPLDAAVREVAEEPSLVDLDFRWGPEYWETPVYAAGKVARYYLAECSAGDVRLAVNPEIGRPEHHEYRWCTYREAEERLGPRLRPILQWARDRVECKAS